MERDRRIVSHLSRVMEFKGSNYGGSEQFGGNYPSGFATSVASRDSNTRFGRFHPNVRNVQNVQNIHFTVFQNVYQMGFKQPRLDPREVYLKRKDGLTKLWNVGVVNLILAVLTTAVGVATLVLASSNIGFPVFNFGVLLVGILHLITGLLCFMAGRKGLNSISETNLDIPITVKHYIVGQFIVSVLLITFSILAAVFAIFSGAVCAGAEVKFTSGDTYSNQVKEIDARQFCEPHKEANSALAFIGGVLCILITVLSIYGTSWVCCYGTVFGWRCRRHFYYA